jgi:acetoacetyl-CoA synthetase
LSREHVTWAQLRERVRICSNALRAAGVHPNDRVAGFLGNHTNTLVAALSAISLGAIWTGVSPDTGVHAVLERLQQIEPVVLFADNATVYNGKVHDVFGKVCEVVKDLPALKHAVIFETVEGHVSDLAVLKGGEKLEKWSFADFTKQGDQGLEMKFEQLDADHPVYILYSSGTTGSKLTHHSNLFPSLCGCFIAVMYIAKLTLADRTEMHCPRSNWHIAPAQKRARAALRHPAW